MYLSMTLLSSLGISGKSKWGAMYHAIHHFSSRSSIYNVYVSFVVGCSISVWLAGYCSGAYTRQSISNAQVLGLHVRAITYSLYQWKVEKYGSEQSPLKSLNQRADHSRRLRKLRVISFSKLKIPGADVSAFCPARAIEGSDVFGGNICVVF